MACFKASHLTGMPQLTPAKKLVLAAALISAAVAFCVYIPSLGNGFVVWDDPEYIYGNPNIKSFDLRWAFTAFVGSTWLPLTLLSFALDYSIWGLDPYGFHLTNSILHTLNTFLLALLAARLARGLDNDISPRGLFLIALSAGLLFGIHPTHVESVAWATERKDVLNAFFFLLGLHAYASYSKALKPGWYVLTLLFFVLSLLSKAMTVTMPVVLLIMDFYPLKRTGAGVRRILIEKLPFFGLSFAAGLVSIWSQSAHSLSTVDDMPLFARLYVAVRGVLFYIYKTLFPVDLAPLYPMDFKMGLNAPFILYVIGLLAITAFAIFMLKKTRAILSAWAYFVVTLLPVIGILQVGKQAAADRYTYLPSMGLVLLAAAALGWLVQRRAKAFVPVLAGLVLVSALLSFLTVRQAAAWKDTLSLWTQEIKAYPELGDGYVHRGMTYVALGRFNEGIADLTKGIGLKPGKKVLFDAYSHRGVAYGNVGKVPEAIADFTQALFIDPKSKLTYQNRAASYMQQRTYWKAIADFQKAASLEPIDGASYTELGLAYAETGDRESAYISLRKAVELGDNAALDHLKVLEGN